MKWDCFRFKVHRQYAIVNNNSTIQEFQKGQKRKLIFVFIVLVLQNSHVLPLSSWLYKWLAFLINESSAKLSSINTNTVICPSIFLFIFSQPANPTGWCLVSFVCVTFLLSIFAMHQKPSLPGTFNNHLCNMYQPINN